MKFTAKYSVEEYSNKLQGYVDKRRRASRKNRSSIQLVIKDDGFLMKKARLNPLMLPRPIFIATLNSTGNGTEVDGRFIFQKFVRAEFWLIVIAILSLETIWVFRLLRGLQVEATTEFLIATSVMLVGGLLALGVILGLARHFARRAGTGMSQITDTLRDLSI